VLVTALVGCAVSEKIARREVPFQTEGDNIKVMTFNIRYGTAADGPNQWEYRRERVFDLIARHGADVVGLQEALDFQVEQIHNALKGYALVTAGRDDGKMAGEHCSILYRTERFKLADSGTFWFSNSPWVSGSKHWGNQIPRICTWARLVERDTDRALFVYNLHLDHQSQTSRFKSAELLARVVSQREPKDPVIVMGDFNMGLDNPAMLYLRRLGYPNAPVELLDSWRLLYPDKPEIRTFHGFEGGTEGIKIDHILIERTTKVLDAQIDRWSDEQGRYPSDHYPVTAVLQLWN
jgi:endonuclease/exonuclease/phosphatase family metal-dependent hydrolase